MSSSYYKYYQDKIGRRGNSMSDRNFKLKSRDFSQYFENTLTKYDCYINGKPSTLVLNDHSQGNNKDLSDDKYIIAKNSTDIKVGDYIHWSDTDWLVFTEEYMTIRTHQQLKMKHVNENVKWIRGGKVINDGVGYGAYVQSQTLYTMGVAVGTTLHVVDSKMSMYMQHNEDTVDLQMNERLFVGRRVYKIKFIDDVSRPGLISYLLDEDTIGEYDNVELSVADYYKYHGKTDIDKPEVSPIEEPVGRIIGDSNARVSKTYKYTLENAKATRWTVEHLLKEIPCYIVKQNESEIVLQFKDDFNFIGKVVNLIAETEDGKYLSQPITIIKKF